MGELALAAVRLDQILTLVNALTGEASKVSAMIQAANKEGRTTLTEADKATLAASHAAARDALVNDIVAAKASGS